MAAIKTVAVFGAAGTLGTPVFQALLDSKKFDLTVVTRPESKATFPEGVKVVSADYSSVDALTEILKGQDAVVSTVGTSGFLGQTVFIDAAIAAGVKRFLPSEFGSDLSNPKVGALAVFGYKLAVRKHLEAKVAAGANITYTYVINSGFLDWGLKFGFQLNWQQGNPEIYDGGDRVFSATPLATVGEAVVGVLTHLEETKNRQVKVSGIKTTQNKLLELAKKAKPEKAGRWETVPMNVKDVEKSVAEAMAKGDFSQAVISDQLKLSIFGGPDYGQPFVDDNELLGIEGVTTEDDVMEIWKKVLA